MNNKKYIINRFTKRQNPLVLRPFWNVIIGGVVVIMLIACSDLGERDNPLDPAAPNYEPTLKSPFEYNLEDWNAKRGAYNTRSVGSGVHSVLMVTDPRDKNVYRTVVINGMRVFAENLRYADSAASVNLKGQTWCYNNEVKNCKIGGRYYTWTAAMDLDSMWLSASADSLIDKQHQGICPDGWHIPDNAEWEALFKNVGHAAQQMAGFSGWNQATNASGFSALPVGYYNYYNGVFNDVGSYAYFWSATEGDGSAYIWLLNVHFASFNRKNKVCGLSVRCMKNN